MIFDFWISDFSNIESWFSQNKSKLFAKQSRNSVFLISINLQLSIPALFCIRHRSKRAMSAFEVSNFLFTLWNRWTKSCENCQIFEWSNSRGELRYFPHSDVMCWIFFKNSTSTPNIKLFKSSIHSVKLQVVDWSTIRFRKLLAKGPQYIRIKFPLHKHSENAWVCY